MLTSCSSLLSLPFRPIVDNAFTELLAYDIFLDFSTYESVFQYCFKLVHWSFSMWTGHAVWPSWYCFFKCKCLDFMNLFTAFRNPCAVNWYPTFSNSQSSCSLSSAMALGDCSFHDKTFMSSVLVFTTASKAF
jgi:hypothetical protein